MRIWSLHPSYLDTKGLVALWRETLLAKNVLEGKTKGYKYHPQLLRFINSGDALGLINLYLEHVYYEAVARGYQFDKTKFKPVKKRLKISVTDGQMAYETKHLLKKLKLRDPVKYKVVKTADKLKPHPVFRIITGNVEVWEIL